MRKTEMTELAVRLNRWFKSPEIEPEIEKWYQEEHKPTQQRLSSSRYGGLIAFHRLEEFWDSLSPEEREFIRSCYGSVLSTGKVDPKELDDPGLQITSTQSVSGFLCGYSSWAISGKRYELADKLLAEAIRRKTNHIDLHFAYNHLIDMCYKRRNEHPEWLERCVDYCLADIEICPKFREEYLQEERARHLDLAGSPFTTKKEREEYLKKAENVTFDILIPSFQRLAIIYEKQGKYEEAIDICNLAISYGLRDSTKGGFEARIERLKKSACR